MQSRMQQSNEQASKKKKTFILFTQSKSGGYKYEAVGRI